jgi:hypothetical protein
MSGNPSGDSWEVMDAMRDMEAEEQAKGALKSDALISPCGIYRHWLYREVQPTGITAVFVGINPSTAGPKEEDQTTGKWRGFSLRNGIREYYAVNPFDFRATDVRELAKVSAPVSADNISCVEAIINRADLLIPCWGNSSKLPKQLRHHLIRMKIMLRDSGKPIAIFGLTKSGDPIHPLMLGYDTPLIDWPEIHA